jgi:hypothetical protein
MYAKDHRFIETIADRVNPDRMDWMLENPRGSIADFPNQKQIRDLGISATNPTCYGIVLWAAHLEHLIEGIGITTGFNDGHGFYYFPNSIDGPSIVGPVVLKLIIERYGKTEDQGGPIIHLRETKKGPDAPWIYAHAGLLCDDEAKTLRFDKTKNCKGNVIFHEITISEVEELILETSKARKSKVYFPRGL